MNFDPEQEWLETNGLGGFASGAVMGCNTRRYHALLCVCAQPPQNRMVLVNKVDEVVQAGKSTFELGCNYFRDALAPQGYQYLSEFHEAPLPAWIYEFSDGKSTFRLEKKVWMPKEQNRTLVQYRLLEGSAVRLRLRPFVTGRFYHSLLRKNDEYCQEIQRDNSTLRIQPNKNCPPVIIDFDGEFEEHKEWYLNFQYPKEKERGLDFEEDAFVPGEFVWELEEGQNARLVFSTEPVQIDKTGEDSQHRLWAEREAINRQHDQAVFRSPQLKRLKRAAGQFLIRRADSRYTMIAGYPWFTDWGRDAMIALPGICLTTHCYYQAASILLHFAEFVSGGMIPNRFPDGDQQPEYNTADGTLWFFDAAWKYFQYSGDHKTVLKKLYPVLKDITAAHIEGTCYGIGADSEDGLLRCGNVNTQLTWMDARVEGKPVTPRSGKPVEIQALWHNALQVLCKLARLDEDPQTVRTYMPWIHKIKDNFQSKFWNGETQSLYDVIDANGHSGETDAAIRPNQILALSLPYDLLEEQVAQKVLLTVRQDLLTPFGLRSLSPHDPQYQGVYGGDANHRDGAYHQGTVWPWLMGPFLSAYLKMNHHSDVAKDQARLWLQPLLDQLDFACTGSISEIYDGNPPHTPRGCVAQAWSVAEVIRVLCEDLGDKSTFEE